MQLKLELQIPEQTRDKHVEDMRTFGRSVNLELSKMHKH